MFTPRHPSTKPVLEKIKNSQAKLDAQRLIDEAVAGVETVLVKYEG